MIAKKKQTIIEAIVITVLNKTPKQDRKKPFEIFVTHSERCIAAERSYAKYVNEFIKFSKHKFGFCSKT